VGRSSPPQSRFQVIFRSNSDNSLAGSPGQTPQSDGDNNCICGSNSHPTRCALTHRESLTQLCNVLRVSMNSENVPSRSSFLQKKSTAARVSGIVDGLFIAHHIQIEYLGCKLSQACYANHTPADEGAPLHQTRRCSIALNTKVLHCSRQRNSRFKAHLGNQFECI